MIKTRNFLTPSGLMRSDRRVISEADLSTALRTCQDNKRTILFAPEVADLRIAANEANIVWQDSTLSIVTKVDLQNVVTVADPQGSASEIDLTWQSGYMTGSLVATGTTKRGAAVAVYAHTQNYLLDPRNTTNAIREGIEMAGRYGWDHAGIIPQKTFNELVAGDGMQDAQGNRLIWVVDYKALHATISGMMSVDAAFQHPQTIPFLGAEKRAADYLGKFQKIHGNYRLIGVWYHDNDLGQHPKARLLGLGMDYGATRAGLNAGLSLGGPFLTVPQPGLPKSNAPALETRLSLP